VQVLVLQAEASWFVDVSVTITIHTVPDFNLYAGTLNSQFDPRYEV
jgi:hypothetical protein